MNQNRNGIGAMLVKERLASILIRKSEISPQAIVAVCRGVGDARCSILKVESSFDTEARCELNLLNKEMVNTEVLGWSSMHGAWAIEQGGNSIIEFLTERVLNDALHNLAASGWVAKQLLVWADEIAAMPQAEDYYHRSQSYAETPGMFDASLWSQQVLESYNEHINSQSWNFTQAEDAAEIHRKKQTEISDQIVVSTIREELPRRRPHASFKY